MQKSKRNTEYRPDYEQSLQDSVSRMKKHAKKTRASFAFILKVKTPSFEGRLSGPVKVES